MSICLCLCLYSYSLPAVQSCRRKQDSDTCPSRRACTSVSCLCLAKVRNNLKAQTNTSETKNTRGRCSDHQSKKSRAESPCVQTWDYDNFQGCEIISVRIQRVATPYVTVWLWIWVHAACDLVLCDETSHHVCLFSNRNKGECTIITMYAIAL